MSVMRSLMNTMIGLVLVVLIVSCGPGNMGPMMDRGGDPPDTARVPTATPGGDTTVSFSQDIQPILSENCVSCHGGSGDLWLDSYERALAESSGGPVIVPGQPQASELYLRITGESEPRMPLNASQLSDDDIEAIRIWISEGAPNN